MYLFPNEKYTKVSHVTWSFGCFSTRLRVWPPINFKCLKSGKKSLLRSCKLVYWELTQWQPRQWCTSTFCTLWTIETVVVVIIETVKGVEPLVRDPNLNDCGRTPGNRLVSIWIGIKSRKLFFTTLPESTFTLYVNCKLIVYHYTNSWLNVYYSNHLHAKFYSIPKWDLEKKEPLVRWKGVRT